MDTVTQQAAASAEETAAAAEEMSSQAALLQALVSKFTLNRAAKIGAAPSHESPEQLPDWEDMDLKTSASGQTSVVEELEYSNF